MTMFLLFAQGCQEKRSVACSVGEASCSCFPDGSCKTTDHSRLFCDRGVCVPEPCTAGSEDCRCYGNGTCDPLDGVPMTCDGNVCRKTDPPDPGELNGPCRENGTCGEHDGQALMCRQGACELVTCPSGELGCPCALYGRCEAEGGDSVVCNQGICVPPDCSTGAIGCPCESSANCEEEAECLAGICRRGGAVASVEGEGVRGCDVVVVLPELAGAKAAFDGALLGETSQRGKRFALSFTVQEDRDFTGDLAVIQREPSWFGDPVSGWTEAVTLESGLCYDRAGVLLDSAEVKVR
jgi:hypothetical protein